MKDKIIAIIRNKGPVIPKDLTKQLKIDTVFAGAHLSELVANKKLYVSTAKIGGSPVYYLPDQRERLQMLYQYLKEKDKTAYDILKQNKILRDIEQQPLIRVALRGLKDFAVPLTVNLPTGQEMFWKWYLTAKEEAELLIKTEMNLMPWQQKQQQPSHEMQHEIKHEAHTQNIQKELEAKHAELKASLDAEKQKFEAERQRFETEKQHILKQKQELELLNKKETILDVPVKEAIAASLPISYIQKETQNIDDCVIQKKEKVRKPRVKKSAVKKEPIAERIETIKETQLPLPRLGHSSQQLQQSRQPFSEFQKQEPESMGKEETKIEAPKPVDEQIRELNDAFLSSLRSYFEAKLIKIEAFTVNRKNAEAELMIKVPTPVGDMKYFCSAKNKQKCNEGDLSAAFVKAQMKKLPLLFLVTGELTKNARLMLENEFKNQIQYQKLMFNVV